MFEAGILQVSDNILAAAIAASSGSLAASVITLIDNHKKKNREGLASISMARWVKISSQMTYYLQMRRYYGEIAKHVASHGIAGSPAQEQQLLMYYIFKALHVYRKLRVEVGGIILSHPDAEDVVVKLAEFLRNCLDEQPLGRTYWFKIADILQTTESFTKFVAEMTAPPNAVLYTAFINWCNSRTTTQTSEIMSKSKCLSEVIIFDINIIYEKWYPSKDAFEIELDGDAQKYLRTEKPRYFDKVLGYISNPIP